MTSAPTPDADNPTRNTDGSPTLENPTVSLAEPGAARIGVPNFFIDKFRIPPFLLPIYQAAGIEYGVRWEVLAAINEVETDYGRNLNVSSAGALGWMQFMPVELGGLRGRRQQGRPQGPVQPGRRDLRRRPLPEGRRRRQGPARRDLGLQPRRLVRRHGAPARAADRRPPRRPRRLAHRPHAGPLPRAGQGHVRERGQARRPRGRQGHARLRRRLGGAARRHPHLRQEGRARRRRQRRPHRRHRPLPPPRQLREAPGRLRQHVHVRPPRSVVQRYPRPARPHGDRRREARRAQAPAARRRPAGPASTTTRGRGRRAQGRARGAGRARRPPTRRPPTRPGCPPSSACSPTPSARAPRPPAASSRRSSTARTSAPTSTASSASTAPTST